LWIDEKYNKSMKYWPAANVKYLPQATDVKYRFAM